MKLRVFCLAAVMLFSGFGVYAQEKQAIRTENELRTMFDDLWQAAVDKGLVKDKSRPAIFVVTASDKFTVAETRAAFISFSPLFFGLGHGVQRFTVGHEIGHWLLDHFEESRRFVYSEDDFGKYRVSWYELHIKQECEANVFAAQLVGHESAIRASRAVRDGFLRTRKKRVALFLLAPVFSTIDIVAHSKRPEDRFGPFGQYGRSHRIHGLALDRAILVLEGKIEDCGCSK